MDEKDKKEEEKKTEEELTEELNEELNSFLEEEREKNKNPWLLYFNVGLHKNYYIHLLLMILVNMFCLSAVIGLIGYGMLEDIVLYLFSVILFTLLEMIFKLLTFRYLTKIVVKSFGAINLVYLIPLYYFTICFLGKVSFGGFFKYILIFVSFLLIRLFVMHYIKRISFRGEL